jgi:predicted double-glycine peptidase
MARRAQALSLWQTTQRNALTGAFLAFFSLGSAHGNVTLSVGGARLEPHVKSMRELRDAGVVKQRYDYSCGSAALSTLFTFGLEDPVPEEQILRDIIEPLSAEEQAGLRKRGLSLFELQKYAQGRGYKAQGFRVAAAQISKVSRPVIVYIKPRGYDHFAVLKAVRDGRAYLADPSLGNVRMPLYRFVDMWADASGRGVVFAVERKDGAWPGKYPLLLAGDTAAPEELTTRELLNVAAPYLAPVQPR